MKHFNNISAFWRRIPLQALLVLAGLSCFQEKGKAQDIQFAQFYASSLYLNPAFAGGSQYTRAMTHQRLQWPGLDANYITSLFSVDTYFDKYNSGVGIMFLRDWQGQNTFSTTEFSLQYSYDVKITKGLDFRPGLQIGYTSRYLNYADMILPEDIQDLETVNPGGHGQFGSDKVNYVDISTGGLIYTNNAWFGFSAHHLNRPNQSHLNNDDVRLPVKYTFLAGYRIDFDDHKHNKMAGIDRGFHLTPTIHYKSQGKHDQLDIGVYGQYDHFLAGFWYRGIPFKRYIKDEDVFHNNESMVAMVGWKVKYWTIRYSYDFMVSTLTSSNPNGGHELTIVYTHKPPRGKKIKKRIPCPSF